MKVAMMVLMWVGGTVVAVGVAWAGVSVVDNQVIDPAPAVDFEVNANAASNSVLDTDPTATSTTPTSSATSTTSTTSTSRVTVTTLEPAGVSSSSTTQSVTTQPAPSQGTTSTTSTTAPHATTVPTTTTSTTAPPTTTGAITHTFSLVGGTTAISFSSAHVEVLWASPNPGFEVKIEPESGGVKVEFRSEAHRSRVDAWWSGGPQSQVQEEAHD